MNEACDRCGPAVRAAYRVERRGELYLCRNCASQQWAALSARGWTIWPAGVLAVAPQASEFPSRQKSRPAGTPTACCPGCPASRAEARQRTARAAPRRPARLPRPALAAPRSQAHPQYHRGAVGPSPDPDPITDQARQRKAYPPAAPVSGRPLPPPAASSRCRGPRPAPPRRRPAAAAAPPATRTGPRSPRSHSPR
jgi:hypothetical protein